jgi:hypothetical protein
VSAINGVVTFQGAPIIASPGQPQLPSYTVTFLLPPDIDIRNVSVSLVNPVEKDLDGTFDVAAALPPSTKGEIVWPDNRNIVNGKDMDVYGRNTFFPADHKGRVSFGSLRQYRFAEVTVYPYLYNPITRKLRMITGGSIVLTMASTGAAVQSAPLQSPRNSNAEKLLKNKIVNPEILQNYGVQPQSGVLQQGTTALAAAPAAVVTYAIITTNAIKNASTQLANLIALKKQKGFNVITVTETSWGGGTGNTAADRIRSWLKINYLPLNIDYVLLIGNPNPVTGDVPMKMCFPQPYDSDNPDAPTDFYYAELTGNWDINNDGVFGDFQDFITTGGPDQYAEVAVGRIPCYGSIASLDKILSKIIRYENETAVEWRRNVMLPMERLDNYTQTFAFGENLKADFLQPKGLASYRLYDAMDTGSIIGAVLALNPPAESRECNEAAVLDAWKKNDFGLVAWVTHGWNTYAADVFSSPNAINLNDQHPSMVFLGSCENAHPEDTGNLAFSLLYNGAVATIGATRVTSYVPGENTYAGSPTMFGVEYTFVGSLVRDNMDVASSLNFVRSSISCSESSYWWRNWLVFNVYGCPDEALGIKPSVITAPSGLTASGLSASQISLSWTDMSTNETGFRIERAPYGGSFKEIAIVGPNVTSYQNTGISAFTTYQYRVRAYNGTDNSLYSNVASGYPFSNIAANKTSSASSVQTANPVKNGNDNSTTSRWAASSAAVPQWWSVDLGSSRVIIGTEVMWEKAVAGYKYRIETSLDNTTWTTRADLTNNTSALQTQAQAFSATARYVRITITGLPASTWASFYEFRVVGNDPPVATPSGVKAIPGDGFTGIYWNPAPGAVSYNVMCGLQPGGPYAIAVRGLNGTSIPLSFTPGITFYWVVSAVNALGESPYSAEVSSVMPLPTPQNLVATVLSSNVIQLDWYESTTLEDAFEVEYALPNGAFVVCGTTFQTRPTFLVSGLSENTTYQFRVRAYKDNATRCYSPYSNVVSATTYFLPGTNLALGKTASASSEETAKGNTAAKGNDGNTTTRWSASGATVPQWWKVDLGSSHPLIGTEVMWEKAIAGYKYRIETSTNNTTWTTQADLTGNTSSLQTQSQDFGATARYVRIMITGLPAKMWAGFFEFRVLGQ